MPLTADCTSQNSTLRVPRSLMPRKAENGKPDVPLGTTVFDPTTAEPIECDGYESLTIAGTCDKPGARIDFRLAGVDGNSRLIYSSAGIGLTSDASTKTDDGYPVTGQPFVVGITGLRRIFLFTTAVNGNWSLSRTLA